MNGKENRAEVFLMALQSLSKAERKMVAARLMDDPYLREDVLDIALIRESQGEPTRSLAEYLAENR